MLRRISVLWVFLYKLVGLVSFFLGLTMALLTGYQLQRFGTERLIPGLVAIGFTRELGPLITGIMLAARIGAAFTAEKSPGMEIGGESEHPLWLPECIGAERLHDNIRQQACEGDRLPKCHHDLRRDKVNTVPSRTQVRVHDAGHRDERKPDR